MFGLLALVFIVVPVVELYVIVQVAQGLGVVLTVALILAVSAAGAWLCKREGLGLYNRIQNELGAGRVPTASLVDGFLVLFGGALLLTPGFVTDALGLALLLPPVRIGVRALLMRRFARKARQMAASGAAGGFGSATSRTQFFVFDGRIGSPFDDGRRRSAGDRVIDVQEADYDRPGEQRAGGDGPNRGELDS